MAERRMFALSVIDSDEFLELRRLTQLLYYHLAMRADDDGFVRNPRSIMKSCGGSIKEKEELIASGYIIEFPSGALVIRHWKTHNYIRKDGYKETKFKEEKAQLEVDENNEYRLKNVTSSSRVCGRDGDEPSTQDRIGKDRIGKDREREGREGEPSETETREEEASEPTPTYKYFGSYKNVTLTEEEYGLLKEQFPTSFIQKIERLSVYMETSGKSYKNHYALLLDWAKKEEKVKPPPNFAPSGINAYFDKLTSEDL